MKKFSRIYYLLLTIFIILFVILTKFIFAQTYVPVTNFHNGISIGFQGIEGEDFIFDRYYYDPLVNDCGLCYIKSDVPITLSHNANNSRISKTSTIITGGDLGVIRYKVDQDFLKGIHWAGDDGDRAWGCEVFPAYSNPVAFDDMEYPKTGEPVVGNTGFSTTHFSDRENLFAKGLLDEVGNEYHYFTYADDDDNNIIAGYQLEYGASDGKSMLFCVNPKTPAIWLNTASSGAEYYTTPAKIYFIPKIHEQISYVTDNVNINLKNIMNSNTVYYRLDGGSYQIYSGAISSNTLSDGSHILEFYYDPSYVQSRTIVKNPDHPCKQDVFEDGSGHGYLLWRDDNEFQRDRDRALTGYFASTYQSYKTDCDQYLGFTGNNGVRNVPFGKSAFSYAMIAMFEGVAGNLEYMEAAKTRLLNNRRMHIENVGFELNWSNAPNPCHEITYRGYVDDRNLYSNAFTYDLIAKYYRSDQYANGITPIQDLRIRDMLAVPAMEGLMIMGDFNTSYDLEVEMWPIAQANAAVMAALAMPSYNTNYLGTSGFDGVQATHSWTPYPDYPSSWKDAYLIYTDKDIQGHQATLHSFPNKKTMFNWFSGNDNSILKADGNWHGRVPYSSTDMMGHGFEFFYNVMKRKFNKTYPTIDLFIEKSINGTLEGDRFSVASDYGPHAYARRCMANEYFPDHAPVAVDANDTDGKYFNRTSPYFYFFHNPDWADVSFCESTVPPSIPDGINAIPGQTEISLSWAASNHPECRVYGYNIFRNGQLIATLQETNYIDEQLYSGIEYIYTIEAYSNKDFPSEKSQALHVSTLSDDVLPSIINASSAKETEVIIEYSEEMDASSVEDIANYSIDNSVTIQSATLQTDKKTVLLNVSALSEGIKYVVSVNNVLDAFGGNEILPNTQVPFEYVKPLVLDNIALNKETSSSPAQSGNGADKLVDGNTTDDSRWSASGMPQWAVIDLGATYDIMRFEVYTYKGRDYQYSLEISTDGTTYSMVVDRTGNTDTEHIIDEVFVTGRYVKMTVTGGGSYTGTWVSINELEVYGVAVGESDPVAVEGVSISPSVLQLVPNQSSNLSASVMPSNASDKSVTWSSNNSDIVTVDEAGKVTAVTEGNAVITVETNDGGFTSECSVTVEISDSPVTGVTLSHSVVNLSSSATQVSADPVFFWDMESEIATIYAKGSDSTAHHRYNNSLSTLQAYSGNSSLQILDAWANCTFDNNTNNVVWAPVSRGSVECYWQFQGEWKEGTMIFQMTGKSSTKDPTYDTNDGFSLRLQEEGVFRSGMGWRDESGTYQTARTSNSNKPVKAVPGKWYHLIAKYEVGKGIEIVVDGEVVASTNNQLGKTECVAWHQILIGNDTYTTDNLNYTDNFAVYDHWVGDVVTGTPETIQLLADVLPASAPDKSVTWESADPSVATVDDNGLVTAKGQGSTVIIVTTNDGGHTAECIVSVDEIADVPVTGISMAQSTLNIDVGQTSQLIGNVAPSNATNKNLNWSSSDNSIATVDANGVMSALSVGQATITATTVDGGFTAMCIVDVSESGNTNTSGNLALNKPTTVTDASWNSAADGTKLVDGDVTDDSKWVGVEMPQSAIVDLGDVFNLTEIRLYTYKGRAYQYTIEVSTDGTSYTAVVDRSKNTDGTQPLTDAIDANGRYVRLTVSGAAEYTGTYISIDELEVYGESLPDIVPVTGVTVSSPTLSLDIGQVSKLTYTVSPENASDKSVTWESSNTTVATVDKDGAVSALSNGQATITVKTSDGEFTDECTVTVSEKEIPVTGISVNQETLTLEVGQSLGLTITISPENATHKEVSWSSSNKSVVSIDSNGKIKALAPGTSTVTVSNANSNIKAECVIIVNEEVISLIHSNKIEKSQKGNISIYPNPLIGDNLTVFANNCVQGTCILKVYNCLGKLVFMTEIFVDKTTQKANITLQNKFNKGLYIVKLEDSFSSTQIKLIVK